MHEVVHLSLGSGWRDDARSVMPMDSERLRMEETALIWVGALFYQLKFYSYQVLYRIGCYCNFQPMFSKKKTAHSPSHPPPPCLF